MPRMMRRAYNRVMRGTVNVVRTKTRAGTQSIAGTVIRIAGPYRLIGMMGRTRGIVGRADRFAIRWLTWFVMIAIVVLRRTVASV